MPKIKKCSLGARHKWEWHKTLSNASISQNSAVFSKKTMYKCLCGETKIAALDPNTQAYERAKAEQK